jgi:hypothetical protein
VPLQFTMPGAWQVDLTVSTGAEQGTISLEITVWA